MGQLSGVVMLAFVGLHVALVLCAVGLGSPRWLEGSLSFNATGANGTVTQEESIAKIGLWKVCVNDSCSDTTGGPQPRE